MSGIAARDAGLARHVGAWGMGAAIINGVVGAGIFSLPAAMAGAAGALAPTGYLLCAVAMALIVICFAEAGSRLPTSGGVYGTVEFAFGPATGFVCGMLTWMASVLAAGGIAGAFASTIGTLVPALAGGPGRAALILGALGLFAAINLLGVREAAWLVAAATVLKLVPLVLFVLIGLAVWAAGSVSPAPVLHAAPLSGLAQAVILGVFAFSGMETPLAASGEVADGHRTLPRALFGAMSLVLVLYIGIQLVAQHLLGAGLAGQAAPLAAAAARIDPAFRLMLVCAAALSMLAWLGSDILGAPRILFAFARDGLLPRALGRASAISAATDIAILTHVAIAAALALSGSFAGLVEASALNTAGLYFLGCGAAWVLHRRDTRMAGKPVSFRFLPACALGSMVAMVVLVCVAPRTEIIGLAAVIAGSLALYATMRRGLRSRHQ